MSVRVTKPDPDHMQAWCEECDWRSPVASIRTAKDCELVARDAHEHAIAHVPEAAISQQIRRVEAVLGQEPADSGPCWVCGESGHTDHDPPRATNVPVVCECDACKRETAHRRFNELRKQRDGLQEIELLAVLDAVGNPTPENPDGEERPEDTVRRYAGMIYRAQQFFADDYDPPHNEDGDRRWRTFSAAQVRAFLDESGSSTPTEPTP